MEEVMAHDRQSVENNNESNEVSKQSTTHSGIVADWLTLFAENYREEITEGLALLYREALSDIPVEVLHKGFLRAAKKCKWRPTPAEVREQAEIELESRKSRTNFPQISQEERNTALNETAELRETLRTTLKAKALPPAIFGEEQLFGDREIFTAEEWAATSAAYKDWLTNEANKDAYNRAHGISPIPRSRNEQLAIYYNMPKHEREKIRKQVRP
jgi:hypothetical protein